MKKLIPLLTLCFVFASCERESVVEEQACDNGTYEGDVFLETQVEVDYFGALCYTSINGNLTIGLNDFIDTSESNIARLGALSSLNEISGNLTIAQIPNLTNLNGLENLSMISGNLEIRKCALLSDFKELSGLTNSNNQIMVAIGNNESLTSLSGLGGISEVGFLALFQNPYLVELEGIGSIGVGASIQLDFNNSLASFTGLNFSGNTIDNMYLHNQEGITSMEGLEAIHEISGTLSISDNDELLNLEGFNNLQSCGSIWINENQNLESLSGFSNLSSTGSVLIGNIVSNNVLSDYCTLQNLFTNGTYGEVTIDNNAYNPSVQDIIDGNCAQ